MINCKKGTIINKKKKFLGYMNSRGGSFLVSLKSTEDDKYYIVCVDSLVWDQINGGYNSKKFRLKHIDGDQNNCSIENLKLEARGYVRTTPKLKITITNKKTKEVEEETYNSIADASKETGISTYIIRQAFKSDDNTKRMTNKITGHKLKVHVEAIY